MFAIKWKYKTFWPTKSDHSGT